MAVRGWGGSVATAIGAAAGAGAAQLGLGYGLGIIVWLPSSDGASESTWVAGLAWALWIAATSTVAGAICADRLASPLPTVADRDQPYSPVPLAAVLGRIALAVAAAIGALVTVALVAVPARAATRADTFSPQTIAAGYAVLGVLLGLAFAIWALSSRAVARNVIATVCWLWLLAVVAVVDGVLSGRGLTAAQLGVWQITTDGERFWFRNHFYWPGAALSLGSALVIGALAARPAARHSYTRVGAAISGGVGPLLVAAAYFLAAPRLVGIRAEQLSAHLMAPYAVIAGLTGSVVAAALAQRAEGPPDRRGPTARTSEPAAPPGATWRPVPQGRPAQPADGAGDTGTGRVIAQPGATIPPRPEANPGPVRAAGKPPHADRPEPTSKGSTS
ncbi:MAG TPA: hypothetical protein VHN18_14900 [Micromonosporaceae bacterium]|nr:hypothetical protein [Micromonosporaceae bacterium]